MRVELPRRLRRPARFLLTIALLVSAFLRDRAYAQTAAHIEPRATLVIFAERRMTDSEWAALFDALREGARSARGGAQALKGGVDPLRGDTMARGLELSEPISVYLHGDCTLVPMPRYMALGALGWVRLVRMGESSLLFMWTARRLPRN